MLNVGVSGDIDLPLYGNSTFRNCAASLFDLEGNSPLCHELVLPSLPNLQAVRDGTRAICVI